MTKTWSVLAVLCMVAASTQARKWEKLSTTFGVFRSTPMTETEAIADGWRKEWSCGDGGKFAGNRYIEPFGHSFLVIYDAAGYIAGVQSMARTLYVEDDIALVDFAAHPAYQLDYLGDWEAYFTTAYFVDPAIICNGGRTEAEFQSQGLGDRLVVQVGETADIVESIPMLEKDIATADDLWYVHKCFAGMGRHIIGYNYEDDQDCNTVMPMQVLYHEGELSGFVWQHQANIPQDPNTDYWEYPPALAIQGIIDSPPKCLMDNVANFGISTVHHYFFNNPWNAIC